MKHTSNKMKNSRGEKSETLCSFCVKQKKNLYNFT